jgi:CheY-like chemotaxis protein
MRTHSTAHPAALLSVGSAASGGARPILSSPTLLASPTSVGGWSHLSASPGDSSDGRPSAGARAGLRPAADARTLAFSGLSALIVDDSDTNRLLMARTLRGLGFACDTAENGASAVAKVAASAGTRAAGSAPPALPAVVLMDKTMPVMGGLDATKQLREAPISYRGLIVGVTGDAGRGDQQDFIRAGADAVLPKPLVKADLVALLHQHLTAAVAAGPTSALACP